MAIKDEMKRLVDKQVDNLVNKKAHWSYMYKCRDILCEMLELAKKGKMDKKNYSSYCSDIDNNLKSLRKAGEEYLKDMKKLGKKLCNANTEDEVYVQVAYNFYHEMWMRTNALYSDGAQHLTRPINEVKSFFDNEYFKGSKDTSSEILKLEKILRNMDITLEAKIDAAIKSLDNFLKICNLDRRFEKTSGNEIAGDELGAPSKSEVESATKFLSVLLYEFCGLGNSYSFLNKLSEMLEILQKNPASDISKMQKLLKIDWEKKRTTKRVSLCDIFSMKAGGTSTVRLNSDRVYDYAEDKGFIKRNSKFGSLLLPNDHIGIIESLDFIVNEPIELTKEELNDLMKRFDKYVEYLQSLSLQVSKWNKALKGKL